MEVAFEEWWMVRQNKSWKRTLLPSEADKPMPVYWGEGLYRTIREGWMGAVLWCRLCNREHEGACITARLNRIRPFEQGPCKTCGATWLASEVLPCPACSDSASEGKP